MYDEEGDFHSMHDWNFEMWLLAETEECDLWIQIVQTNRFCKKKLLFLSNGNIFTSFAEQAQVFLKNIFSEKNIWGKS